MPSLMPSYINQDHLGVVESGIEQRSENMKHLLLVQVHLLLVQVHLSQSGLLLDRLGRDVLKDRKGGCSTTGCIRPKHVNNRAQIVVVFVPDQIGAVLVVDPSGNERCDPKEHRERDLQSERPDQVLGGLDLGNVTEFVLELFDLSEVLDQPERGLDPFCKRIERPR